MKLFMTSSLFTKFHLVEKSLLFFWRCDILYLLHRGLLALYQLMLHKTLVFIAPLCGYIIALILIYLYPYILQGSRKHIKFKKSDSIKD